MLLKNLFLNTGVLLILLFICRPVLGQTRQFAFQCDNDFFLLAGSDRYYTAGLFFTKTSLIKKESKFFKQVRAFELGQEIFMPNKRKIAPQNFQEIDRPISAWLYLSYKHSSFINKYSIFSYTIRPGIIGPGAFGKEVQTSWHRLIGIPSKYDWVWDYQIRNQAGIDVLTSYSSNIIRRKSLFQLTPIAEVSAGTIQSYLKTSMLFQLGRISYLGESDYWDSKIIKGTDRSDKSELFLYYLPSLTYQAYNATIQGGLFGSKNGEIVGDPNRLLLSNELGLCFATNKYGITFKLIYQGREAISQFDSHIYGSIKTAVRLP